MNGHKMAVAALQLLQCGATEVVPVTLSKTEILHLSKDWTARIIVGEDEKTATEHEARGPTPYDAVLNALEMMPLPLQLKAQGL